MARLILVSLLVFLASFISAQVPDAPSPFICGGPSSYNAVLCFYSGANTDYFNISIRLNQPGQPFVFYEQESTQSYMYFNYLDVGQSYTIRVASGNAASGIWTSSGDLNFTTQGTDLQTDILWNNEIVLGWGGAPNDASYTIIKRPTGSGLPYSAIVNDTTNTYFYDYNVVAGGRYDYQILTRSVDGFLGTTLKTYTQSALPDMPDPLVILSSTSDSFYCSWANSVVSVVGVAYYRIYTAPHGTGSYSQFGPTMSGSQTSVNITGLTPSTQYDVLIGAGTIDGGWMNAALPAVVTTPAVNTIDTLPSPATGFYIVGFTPIGFVFSWSSVSNALYYVISCTANYPGSLPLTMISSLTQNYFTQVVGSTDYTCSLYAGNNAGLNPVSSTPLFAPTNVETPSGIAVTLISPYEVTVSWNAFRTPNNVQYFVIAWPGNSVTVANTTTFYEINSLTPNTSYSVTVQAVNSVSTATSNSLLFTTNPLTCTTPGSFMQVAPYSRTQVSLTWTASTGTAGVSGYLIDSYVQGFLTNISGSSTTAVTLTVPASFGMQLITMHFVNGLDASTSTQCYIPRSIYALDAAGNLCSASVELDTFTFPPLSLQVATITPGSGGTAMNLAIGAANGLFYAEYVYVSSLLMNISYVDPVTGPHIVACPLTDFFISFGCYATLTGLQPNNLYSANVSVGYFDNPLIVETFPISFSTNTAGLASPTNLTLTSVAGGYVLQWSCPACSYNNTFFVVENYLLNSVAKPTGQAMLSLFANNTENYNQEQSTWNRSPISILPQPYGTYSYSVMIACNQTLVNQFVVYALNDAVTSILGESMAVSNLVAPTLTSASTLNNTITILWAAPATGPIIDVCSTLLGCNAMVVQYVVNCGSMSSGIVAGAPAPLSYTFLASYGTSYSCSVAGYYNFTQSISGSIESQFSAPTVVVTPCTAPIIAVTFPSSTSTNITWAPVNGAASFTLYYRIGSTGSFTAYASNIHTLFYYANNLPTGTTFDAYVTAYNTAGTGTNSQIARNNIIH